MPQAEEAAESHQGLSTRNDGLADRRAGHLYNIASEVIREALRSSSGDPLKAPATHCNVAFTHFHGIERYIWGNAFYMALVGGTP